MASSAEPTPIIRFIRIIGRDRILLVMAAGIGMLMAMVAMGFILPIRWLERQPERLAEIYPQLHLAVIFAAPAVGALLTGLVIHLLPVPSKGLGVSAVLYAIHRTQSRLPLKLALTKWLASTATIASGGSAGPEGPIVAIGASIGASIAHRLRADVHTTTTMLGCAAAAGISSVFNAPIAGVFFVLEVLLRDFSLRTLMPIVVASVVSTATTQAFLGSTPLFGVGPSFFASHTDHFTLVQIPNYLMLGAIVGIASVGFIRLMNLSEKHFARLRVHPVMRPVIGAALLGTLGVAYSLIARDAGAVPPFFGNGYHEIERLLQPGYFTRGGTLEPMHVLVPVLALLAVLKVVATCFTLGSGGSGGLFAPSLVLGATIGAAFGHIVASLHWLPSANPAHYALVGMAACLAATTHAPLTAILIVYELTLSYDIILPLMLASVVATVEARALFRESIYTSKLVQLGLRFSGAGDQTLMRRLTVADVPLLKPIVVRPTDTADRLIELSERYSVGDFIVLDEHDAYSGMVTGVDLRSILVYRETMPILQVVDFQRSDLPVVLPDETLDMVLEKFNRTDVHCLAVVEDLASKRVRGVIARSRVLREYQSELARD